MFGCCSNFLRCQTSGKCERCHPTYDEEGKLNGWTESLGPKNEDGDLCQLWQTRIATPFPLLYKLKQKGFIGIEDNYLTEAGEKYLFENWSNGSDAVNILNIIYVLQMVAKGYGLSPIDILAITRIMKGDRKKWVG